MPNTPNLNTSASLVTPPAEIKTNLGPVGGDVGEIEEYDTKRLTPVRIIQSEGGELAIEFEYNLAEMDERLKDMEFINGYEQLVEVEQAMPSGTPDLLLAWGEILTQEPKVDSSGERARIIARVTPHHFGTPLIGMHVLNDDFPGLILSDSDPLIHEGEIVFNPEINGKITGNTTTIRSSVHKTYGDAMSSQMILKLWVDPESMRTETARVYIQRDYKLAEWTLREAIHSLCWVCNPLETFILNPTLAELDAVDANDVKLRNLVFPAGLYLNELLNLLLKPHGYSWYLQVGRNDDPNSPDYGSTEIRIKVFKLGRGVEKSVHQPKPGTVLAAGGPQNCIEWSIRESFDELRNQVTALGGLLEREITLYLNRGWKEDLDKLGPDDLAKDGELYEKHRNVWRLWVGDEAGDYGLSNDRSNYIHQSPGDYGFLNDLSPVFKTPTDLEGGQTGMHRRSFKECFTLQDKSEGVTRRRNPLIEWKVDVNPRIITLKTVGNLGPPLFPVDYQVSLEGMRIPTGGGHSLGAIYPNSDAAWIKGILDSNRVTYQSVTGTMEAGIVITFTEDGVTDDFFYIADNTFGQTGFTGGLNPAILLTDNSWQPIPDGWGPVILGDELGVYFNGDKAVEDLFAKGDRAMIRITGTVTGDTRIKYTSEKQLVSPLGHVHEMVVDVSDRFFDRKVVRSGPLMSVLTGVHQDDNSGESGTDEVDSTDKIEEYADELRQIEDAVNITGSLTLGGIRPEYEISDLITRIEGREISLNRVEANTSLEKYVQITEIETILQPQQRTILKLLPLDQTESARRSRENRHRRKRRR